MSSPVHTVLFDLDGTLVDTAPDLALALNTVLTENQRPPLDYDRVRPWVSNGARYLIQRGFELDTDTEESAALLQRLLEVYAEHLADKSALFAGMQRVLEVLEEEKMQWGIVTNKPTRFTEPLLEKLQLRSRCCCVVSGDTLPQKKPHPAPLWHACELCHTEPEYTVYLGDAMRDIEAGQRAGIRSLVALYGYIEAHENPQEWGAVALLRKPEDLLGWIDQTSFAALP